LSAAQPLFSVIVPNWNGAQHLPTCLESLRRQTWRDFELLIPDNGSTDGSLTLLAGYPEAQVLPLGRNLGFTGACNAGLRAARGEFCVLLNNDTEADPRWLEELAAAFARHPEVGLVASKMRLFDRRDTFHTAGDYVSLDGLPHNRGVWEQDTGQYDHEAYVFSACGGSAAYRRALLDELGPLDEDFFFSCEDVDLAWRAQLAGWRCLFAPPAIVYHKLSATGGGTTASFYDGRNRLYLLVKNYPADLWHRYRGRVIAAQLRIAWTALRAWRGAAARATLRGQLAGLAALPRLRRKRAGIQTRRRVEIAYLERLMTPPYEIPVESSSSG